MTSGFRDRHTYVNASRTSVESYYRRPRPHCADQVYVSSSSVLYLGALDPPLDKPSVSSHQRRSEAVGLVSLRAILYIGDAHESQEMTFFLEKEGGDHSSDSDADHHYEMLYEVVGNNKEDIAPYDDFDSFDSDVSDETYIKPLHQRLFNLGNAIRTEDSRIPKNILNSKPEGRRNIGRQKLRWLDDVEVDLRALGVKRWRQKAIDRQKWAKILREAKARLQGPEAWTIRTKDESRLTACEMRFMRRTAGYTKWDRKKNEDILQELNVSSILDYISRYQLNWKEHVSRMEGYDIANGRLPEPPAGQNIYGISKIAEAAGKKMLKLGKSLRKIRNKRNNNNAAGVQLKTCPPLPTTPRPPPPSPPPPALPSPPVPPPRISEKSVSSGNLAGRKYWSLRKFKRSVSASDQTPPSSPASGPKKETATFYLTPALDADTGGVEGSSGRRSTDTTDICSENGDTPTSPSSMSSSKTVVYDSGMEANYSQDTVQKTVANATTNKKQRPTSAPERRSSGNIRPNSPPPLPPHSSSSADAPKRPARKEKRNSGSTSWYAECGLFDQTADAQNIAIVDTPKRNVKKPDRPISNSWYAEVGLWDMSTSSPNDSSLSEQDARSQHTDLSGGDSPLTAGSPENSGVVERRFADEPLYQFYTAAVVERDMRSELDSDGYEEIGDNSRKPKQSRPTAMELIRPRDGQHRTLWCEIPEVVNSRVLSTISPHQKKLQEAKFEIITSEASYMNSLNVLEKHFISSLELCDESVLSKNDKRTLFSNLIPVKSCSENFLAELEACWQDNILLHGICEVVLKHASNNFNVYIKYCSNQICLDRTLRGLKEQNGKFAEVLAQLESGPVCQALSLHSFLMLPMQRITRLPLLIDAVLTRLDPQDDEYNTCRLALATLNKTINIRYPPQNWRHLYTDGSLISREQSAGAGVTCLFSLYRSLGYETTSFDGEIIAISESLRNLLCHINKLKNAVILSDSKAAILSIVSKHTPSSQTAEITKMFSQLISFNKRIVFQWIPSHCGILGNENADALAKKGSTATYRPVTKSTYYSVKRFIKSTYLDFNKQNLKTQSQGKKWNSLHQNPQLIPDLPRKSSVAAFRLATGHACLAKHLHRIGIYLSPNCPLCNSNQEMDSEHLKICASVASHGFLPEDFEPYQLILSLYCHTGIPHSCSMQIVQNCNEDARRMERMEEILILSPQLYFPSEVKAVPIISSARWLVKKGELTQLVWRGDEGKLTFGKKFSRVTIHMFLFTDLLVITKKKRKTTPDATGDECYAVIDYCPRNLVQMTSAEGMSNLPVKFTSEGGRNLMLLTMLQNHEKKTVEMILSCSMESDRQRWLEAVNPPVSDNPDETVYEEWDCPQVTAVHPYVARQPDELSLEVADVVNVLRKITDGKFHITFHAC
ncbi:hypothetical protein ANN_19730 [Periplaneta americana]|uniref:Uncharacterized protein n=1 Tax=Periplaneta americana TaxID=6978 RepID=A0ABQ8SBC7_PERAM|nr:hypothetical protein ANN_19730 [Periplaneta americana]